MASGCKQSNSFYLLQPELLNEAALKQILELVSMKLIVMSYVVCLLMFLIIVFQTFQSTFASSVKGKVIKERRPRNSFVHVRACAVL
jgi:hypothetical protein